MERGAGACDKEGRCGGSRCCGRCEDRSAYASRGEGVEGVCVGVRDLSSTGIGCSGVKALQGELELLVEVRLQATASTALARLLRIRILGTAIQGDRW
jgi:hypothetical protein